MPNWSPRAIIIQDTPSRSPSPPLPLELRFLTYSFFDITYLIKYLSKLSNAERNHLAALKLGGQRGLQIKVDELEQQFDYYQLKFAIKICSFIELVNYQSPICRTLVNVILSLAHKYKK